MAENLTDQFSRKWYVAVIYADLCDSTALAANLEAEVYAAVMDRLTAYYRQTIDDHGGTMLQVHGDGALAMFGFPAAGEEDVRLAVNAALALHAGIKELVFPEDSQLSLRLHTGVHAGLVVIQQGDIHRGTYQLRGDVTHVCARLSDLAASDEILVTEQSLRGSKPFFTCTDTRVETLRGFGRSIEVTRVIGKSMVTSRYQARRKRSRLPFVGRRDELSELLEAWQAVRAGQASTARVINLIGPPGVGKTRLVDEFLGHGVVQEYAVLQGFCENLGQARPLEPFLNMTPTGIEAPLAATKTELIDQLSQLTQPYVLFVDDCQWIDESSIEVLRSVVASGSPVLLIMASRNRRNLFGATPGVTHLELDGLSSADVSLAIRVLAPYVVVNVGETIAQLCGGNPLFLEELCYADLLEVLDHAPSAIEYVPQWLYSLVQARVAALSAQQVEIVQAAAVLGGTVELVELKEIVGQLEDDDLTHLAVTDLLFPGEQPGTWRFKHGLTREIVYHLIGRDSRRNLHQQVAQRLLAHAPLELQNLERLVGHLLGAGERHQAGVIALRAGENALKQQALDIARVQLRIAIECREAELLASGAADEQRKDIFSIARKLSRVVLFDPSVTELPLFERVLQLSQVDADMRNQAIAHYWLGTVHYGLGQPRLAMRYHFRARTLAQEIGHERLVQETEATLAQATAANCQHDVAIGLLRKVIAANPQVTTDMPIAGSMAYSMGCLAMVQADRGDFEQAEGMLAQAMGLIAETGQLVEANVLAKGIAMSLWQEQPEIALTRASRVIEISLRIHNEYLETMARMLAAYATWCIHQQAQDLEVMRGYVDRMEGFGQGQFMSLGYGWLAEISAQRGEFDRLRRYAARALWRSRSGDGFGLACAYRGLAVGSVTQHLPYSPQHYLQRAQRSAEQRGAHRDSALNARCAQQLNVSI